MGSGNLTQAAADDSKRAAARQYLEDRALVNAWRRPAVGSAQNAPGAPRNLTREAALESAQARLDEIGDLTDWRAPRAASPAETTNLTLQAKAERAAERRAKTLEGLQLLASDQTQAGAQGRRARRHQRRMEASTEDPSSGYEVHDEKANRSVEQGPEDGYAKRDEDSVIPSDHANIPSLILPAHLDGLPTTGPLLHILDIPARIAEETPVLGPVLTGARAAIEVESGTKDVADLWIDFLAAVVPIVPGIANPKKLKNLDDAIDETEPKVSVKSSKANEVGDQYRKWFDDLMSGGNPGHFADVGEMGAVVSQT